MIRLISAAIAAAFLLTTPAHAETTGAFIALSVADAPKAAAWYRDVLGFTLMSEGKVPDRPIRFALLRQGDNIIEIVEQDEAVAPALGDNGQRQAWRTHGIFKAGFYVDNLDAAEADLKARGAIFAYGITQPKDQPWRTFAVRDPEGNMIQFFGL